MTGRPLSVLAWPDRNTGNPYTGLLYDAVRDPPDRVVSVAEFSLQDAWRSRADVLHVHWPEGCVESPSTVRASAKTAAFLSTVAILRRRGTTVVWTCHNLASHETHHPRLERVLRDRFFSSVDGVIHLSTDSAEQSDDAIPQLIGTPRCVVRHGHYRDLTARPYDRADARRELGLDPEATVLAAVGHIRPYKNVPGLIDTFTAADPPGAHLLVAGNVREPGLRAAVERAAGHPRVHLDLRWLTEDELALRLAASDAVVLPYRNLHNSGAAIMALSADRPVAISASGAIEDLASITGPEWTMPLEGELTTDQLAEVTRWAGRAREGRPDLSPLDWDAVAAETLAAYDRFRAHP
jgi:glycosyltransferase involved in cell wall biosynthesis